MANEQNLEPHKFKKGAIDSEIARENGRKGGLAKAKKAREIKSAREYAQAILNAEITDKDGKKYIFKDALLQKLSRAAFNQLDLQAIKFMLELTGESVQKMEVTGKDGQPLMAGSDMSRKELIAEIRRLQKNRNYK